MRIFLTGPDNRGAGHTLWIDLDSPLPEYHRYTIRVAYRTLRKRGFKRHESRWMIYELLTVGRHVELGSCYR